MPSTRGKRPGVRSQKKNFNKAAGHYVAGSTGRTLQNTRAGIKGGVVGGVAGTFVAPGVGTAVGAIAGVHVGQTKDARKQFAKTAAGKKAIARANAAKAKDVHGKKSITASHKGRAGNSPSTTTKSKAKAKGGSHGKKSNYAQDAHGRFAGSK